MSVCVRPVQKTHKTVSVSDLFRNHIVGFLMMQLIRLPSIPGLPQKTGTATLTVNVDDINDNFPEFAPYSNPSITENQNYPGTTILPFSIIDRDLPVNGPPFTFNLNCTDPQASTQCNKFTVAPASGM